MNDSYILAMKDARDFAAKEGLNIEQAGKLGKILDRLDEARRGEIETLMNQKTRRLPRNKKSWPHGSVPVKNVNFK